ncbi:Protein of unknown function DUF3431 [Penicillium canariense]|uniref:Uncharacterized protein n=1 Tax=Penicillium canariense TaxID=189055 RepID=A0A9W9IKC2_9EURO|nr:Protein of unknown function DUF3431 [Penicillium canariense]KAJ5177271.1 Protein of unknown function DUF3431 [Penicillium canariense]
MNWLLRLSFPSRKPGAVTSTRGRLFVYLALTAIVLLFSYQLVLNRESFSSDLRWAVGNGLKPPVDYVVPVPETPREGEQLQEQSDDMPLEPPEQQSEEEPVKQQETYPFREKELVLAAMSTSNMSWVEDHVPQWHPNIYRADVPPGEADLTVPANKGNEAMVFLTYIIDRYETLPSIVAFMHGGRYQWHNDNPLYDSVISMNDLQLDYVREAGYVNLRCSWVIGCPVELEPARYLRERPEDEGHPTALEFPDRFLELFPGEELPEVVGTACCSQFAVSREKIQERGVEHYIRYRQFLIDTKLGSEISGRIFEYVWHIMFGKPAQHCPDPRDCYCRTYGYCNMTEEELQKQWEWRGLALPEGWPDVDESAGLQKRGDLPSVEYWRKSTSRRI